MPESQQPIEGRDLMLARIIGKSQRLLDVGAGDGKWGNLLTGTVPFVIGLDVWKPCCEAIKDMYDEVIECDIRAFEAWADIDTVILGDVLEHLPRKDGLALIHKLKSLALDVYLTIPITDCVQEGSAWHNPFETHLDQWSDEKLVECGWICMHKGLNPNGKVMIGTYYLDTVKARTETVDVTIIIPCSIHHSQYINESVASCFAGTVLPKRVIVVEDHQTPFIIESEIAPAILIRLNEHRERSHARNVGAKQANTRWLFFLDADDLLAVTAMADFALLTKNKQRKDVADLYFADYDYCDNEGNLYRVVQKFVEKCPGRVQSQINIGMFVRCTRFHLIGGFDEDMAICEHRDFFLRYIWNPQVRIYKYKRPFFIARQETSVLPNATARMEQGQKKIRTLIRGGYYKSCRRI